MKVFILFLLLTFSTFSFSQKTGSQILNKKQIIQRELAGLSDFSIYRAYEFWDKGGVYELVLCENKKIVSKNDTLNTKIQAICGMNDHGGFLEKWTINDLIEDTEPKESDIWFWTKYCTIKDLDNDGYIEPIIIYGSRNENGEIRRIKIIVIYKSKKYVIRAVECDLDDCRSYKKDTNWNVLPPKIKTYVEKLIEKLRKEQNLLLKDG
ncbi:MAG: hypothetical protein ABI576_20505 [Flavobacterium sp.]